MFAGRRSEPVAKVIKFKGKEKLPAVGQTIYVLDRRGILIMCPLVTEFLLKFIEVEEVLWFGAWDLPEVHSILDDF